VGQNVGWSRGERIPLIVDGLRVGYYRPDFQVWYAGSAIPNLVEVKGRWNQADRLRVRLFLACYPEARLLCVRAGPGGQFETMDSPQPVPVEGVGELS